MKNLYFILQLALLLMVSCTNNEPSIKNGNKLNITEGGFEFKLEQRNQIEIPSDANNVFCTIDDITAGQTNLTIKSENTIIVNRPIREGEMENFIFNSDKYSIQCLSLMNKLIGEDYGYFKISSQSITLKAAKDESDQIEKLLKKIESSSIIFIRNGSEYNSKEAAEHLRSKLNEADGQIKTLDEFIENIASKSSMTGKAYLVKLKNGKVISAKEWYKGQMEN